MTTTLPWLETMRQLTGTQEVPGPGNNPEILRWASEIAGRFPDMTTYCRQFTNDAIPWCGLTVGYVMAMNGIRPPFAAGDTGRFLWANAWASWGRRLDKPVPGAVMVFTRNGGGHVTLYEGEDDNYYHVRGGNQADAVNVARYPKRQLTCAVWPPGVPLPGEVPVAAPPLAPEGEVPPVIDPKTKAPTIPAEPPKPMSGSRIGKSAIALFWTAVLGALSSFWEGLTVLPGKFQDVAISAVFKPHVISWVIVGLIGFAIYKWRREMKTRQGV